LYFLSHQAELAEGTNKKQTQSAHLIGCDIILTTDSDNMYYIYHFYNIFFGCPMLRQN
jgi:hypothetical protein